MWGSTHLKKLIKVGGNNRQIPQPLKQGHVGSARPVKHPLVEGKNAVVTVQKRHRLVDCQWVLKQRRAWVTGELPRVLAPLATLGRWSLTFYMLHQPVLIGLLTAIVALRKN